jgi:hypothetical protein
VKVQTIMERDVDVVKPSWLLRALESGSLISFSPMDMISTSSATSAFFAKNFDPYGDPYFKVQCSSPVTLFEHKFMRVGSFSDVRKAYNNHSNVTKLLGFISSRRSEGLEV